VGVGGGGVGGGGGGGNVVEVGWGSRGGGGGLLWGALGVLPSRPSLGLFVVRVKKKRGRGWAPRMIRSVSAVSIVGCAGAMLA